MELTSFQFVPLVLWGSVLLDFFVSLFVKDLLLFHAIVEKNALVRINDQSRFVLSLVSLVHKFLKFLLCYPDLPLLQAFLGFRVHPYALGHDELLSLKLQLFQLFLNISDSLLTIVSLFHLAMLLVVVAVVVRV